MSSPNPDHTGPKIPHATQVDCELCQGERRYESSGNLGYHFKWRVINGPYEGQMLSRTLWDTPNGRGALLRDCRTLGLSDPDELCRPRSDRLVIRGGVSVQNGECSLGWIDSIITAPATPPNPDRGGSSPLGQSF